MRKPLPLIVFLLALALCAPRASAASPNAFDPGLALAHATHLAGAIGERPAGSVGEQVAAGWLAAQFAQLGYDIQLQAFPMHRYGVPITGMNVIAIKPGAPEYGVIYVGAHFDTVYRLNGGAYGGPGANDNASGTGVLLELARVVARESYSPTLKFIAFGAEEDGLVGSRFFVNTLSFAEHVRAEGMLNLDCVGLGERLNLYYARLEDLDFAAQLGVDADYTGLLPWGGSDHYSFASAGIPAAFLNLETAAGEACGPDYHKPTDTADKLEVAALDRVGDAAVTALESMVVGAEPRTVYWQWLPYVHADQAAQ